MNPVCRVCGRSDADLNPLCAWFDPTLCTLCALATEAPRYWQHETGGELARAMGAFLEGGHETPDADLALIRAYIVQWIDSPAWELNPMAGTTWERELGELRLAARRIATVRALRAWLERAEEQGIDPL